MILSLILMILILVFKSITVDQLKRPGRSISCS